MYIYIFLAVSAVLFAFLSQGKKVSVKPMRCGAVYEYEKFSRKAFITSFLILALGCFFSKSGTDFEVYVDFYNTWTLNDIADLSFEIGDKILFIALRVVFKNPHIGLGIVKIISICLVYVTFFLLRDRINIGVSVTGYVVLLYVFNFHLLRMMLALGIVFLAFALESKGKGRIAFFLLCMAVLFHYTAFISVCAYSVYLFFKKKISSFKIIVFLAVMLFFIINVEAIISWLVYNISFFNKYRAYLDNQDSSIGITQILLFMPTLLLLYLTFKSERTEKEYALNFILAVMTFVCGSLGYLFPVIGRSVYYFYYFFIIYGASMPLKSDRINFALSGNIVVNSKTIILVVYFLMQLGLMYVVNNSFETNGLTDYLLI